MTFGLYILWAGCVLCAFCIVNLVQLPLRRGRHPVLTPILMAVKFLLSVIAALMEIALDTWLSWHAGFVLGALHIALFADATADLVLLIPLYRKKQPLGRKLFIIVSLVLTVALALYGTLNMQATARANEHTYTSEKLTKEHTFAFLSDLHVGTAQSPSTIERNLKAIKDSNPDFIVLGGDITDEFTKKEEMQDIYRQLGALGIPVYFVYGNHDRQAHNDLAGGRQYTPEDLEQALEANGIIILKDRWVRISDDLVLLGREDVTVDTRLEVSQLQSRPEGTYVVSVDHAPFQLQDIIDTKADLQMSGHTHAGQMFPLQAMYNLLGYDALGDFRYGDTTVCVSAGISGWGIPYRTESNCVYELVHLVPAR
ncbi:MAG: metallophosphoesterase [Spirochaetales bacterium]|nr:metallophosphoesterase [Spirochaetales bacterium]